MFAVRVIADHSLRPTADGYQLTVRIPWYRALPLSSVTNVTVALDGTSVDSDRIRFQVDGEPYALTELGKHWDRWWYVRDDAELLVHDPVPLGPGTHEVRASLGLYIPYLPAHGEPLVVTEWCTKTMQVEPALVASSPAVASSTVAP
jgi:hypothetical protein